MIVFAWEQFPQYAARAIGAFVKSTAESVIVVATRPNAPVTGMERIVGCPVVWIKGHDDMRGIEEVVGAVPRAIFTTGWSVRPFNLYRDQVRANGGRAYAMVDNNFQLGWKDWLKNIRFQLLYRWKYDGYLVPGNSGIKLMRFLGVPDSRVRKGFYSADETLFTDGKPLQDRRNRIVFVGQFIKRKNVIRLCKAFMNIENGKRVGWVLELYGYGVLKEKLPKDDGIKVKGFLQPEQIASIYKDSKIFILPSLEEHWGLVVHEAALSGCIMLVSKTVGAAEDFVSEKNGLTFNPKSVDEIKSVMESAMSMTEKQLCLAEKVSVELGGKINLSCFVEGVRSLLELT